MARHCESGRQGTMPPLAGTKTENNLKKAIASALRANRRCLYFAQKADAEGYNDIAAVFRSTAEREMRYVIHLRQLLKGLGD